MRDSDAPEITILLSENEEKRIGISHDILINLSPLLIQRELAEPTKGFSHILRFNPPRGLLVNTKFILKEEKKKKTVIFKKEEEGNSR